MATLQRASESLIQKLAQRVQTLEQRSLIPGPKGNKGDRGSRGLVVAGSPGRKGDEGQPGPPGDKGKESSQGFSLG